MIERIRNMKFDDRRMVVVSIITGCALALLFGWMVGSGSLGGERDSLLREREKYVNVMQSVREQRRSLPEMNEREDMIVARTFGGDSESVHNLVRQRLYELASSAGLSDITAGTTSATARGTPARKLFKRSGSQKELREEIDFYEIDGSVSGVGTYEQVMRLLSWVDADGWIKRIQSVRFDPGADGSRIRATIKLVTIFLPGREPATTPGPGEFDTRMLDTVLASNLFSLPVPDPPETSRPDKGAVAQGGNQQPSTARRFPYDKWLVTGVVDGPDGPEAWLRNAATNERRTLQLGGTIGKAVLLAARGEDATFELGERTFDVRIGKSIAAGRDTSR